MPDFNRRPGAQSAAPEFGGAAHGGSVARFMPCSPLSDAEERKLASELLEVASEAELGQVLGDLLKKASRGTEPVGSKVIGPVEGLLKTVAKKALPSIEAAVGKSFGGPGRDATFGTLGSLVNQALQAKVAGMTAADPELEKCRQLFEKYRQFVRLAGKATKAAAAAPIGVAPVAVAQKILADSAKETLKRKTLSAGIAPKFGEGPLAAAVIKPTVRAGKFAEVPLRPTAIKPSARVGRFVEPALATPAIKTTVADRAGRRATSIGPQTQVGRVCSGCDLPPGSCRCKKVGRTGRWFRDGTSIIVNC
jgi:hypothetical protein